MVRHQHHCFSCRRDWECLCWKGPSPELEHSDTAGEDTPEYPGLSRPGECIPCWVKRRRPRVYHQQGLGGSYRAVRLFDRYGVIELSEGGWNGRRWMSSKEVQAAISRWVKASYRPEAMDGDDWIPHQCGGCRYFGAFDSDYGLCFNPMSPLDGHITFEHGGCLYHSNLSLPSSKPAPTPVQE